MTAGGGEGARAAGASDIQNLLAKVGAETFAYYAFAPPQYPGRANAPAAPQQSIQASPENEAPIVAQTPPQVDAPPKTLPELAVPVSAHVEINPPMDAEDEPYASSYVSLEAADALRAIAAASLASVVDERRSSIDEAAAPPEAAAEPPPIVQPAPEAQPEVASQPEPESAAPPAVAAEPELEPATAPPSAPMSEADAEPAADPEPEVAPATASRDDYNLAEKSPQLKTMSELFAPVETRKTPKPEPPPLVREGPAAAPASASEASPHIENPAKPASQPESETPVQGTLEDLFRRL